MLANLLSYYRSTSYIFSANTNDPFRQQQGVRELCKYIIFHSKSSEGSSEAQIKLPKPGLTYVLAQCLNNL